MSETENELRRPLTAAEGFQRHRVIGDTKVSVAFIGNGSFYHVRVSRPNRTPLTRNHDHEADALANFARYVRDIWAQANILQPGDEVIRTAEPDGPRGIVEGFQPGANGMWAIVRWGRSLNAYGSPVSTLSKAPAVQSDIDGLMAEELARPLRDAVRAHVAGGGERFLDELVSRAEDASMLLEQIQTLADAAEADSRGALGEAEQWSVLETLLSGLRNMAGYKP